jgi:arylsulfatase A-like enzyme
MAKLRDPWEIIRRQGEPRTEFDLDQIIDLYDGCVKNFDDEVARILDYLENSGLADNTIVLIFSDHGFEFFEHETWGQGNSAIGDFSARVPLIISDPRHPQPALVPEVVRTVDIAPTLLELAGLPVREGMEGVSLVPLMRGGRLPNDLPAFYETGVWLTELPGTPDKHLRYPDLPDLLEVPDKRLGMISLKSRYLDITTVAKDRMVRLGDWKLTYQPLTDGPLHQLFNIAEDPECRRNLIDRHPDIAERLRALLQEWMEDDPDSRTHARVAAAESLSAQSRHSSVAEAAKHSVAAGAPLGANLSGNPEFFVEAAPASRTPSAGAPSGAKRG